MSRGKSATRDAKLADFPEEHRSTIALLMASSDEIADLLESFPALLFALATSYGTLPARQAAFDAVVAGKPLPVASDALGLPWWLRRLPACAFRRPLSILPADDDFGLKVINAVPGNANHLAVWLERIAYAAGAIGPEFALWVATTFRGAEPSPGHEHLTWLTAWAWHSLHTDTLGHRLIRRPWTPTLGARRALEEVGCWQNRIAMISPVERAPPNLWCEQGEAMGLRFVPLVTVEDLIAEATAMDNCLDQYGLHLECGTRRVYSIRKGDRRVANVDLGPHPTDTRIPQIVQLRGPRNRRVDSSVWQATFAWMAAAATAPPSVDETSRRRRLGLHAIRRFWAPHLRDVAGTEHSLNLEQLLLNASSRRQTAQAARAGRPMMRAMNDHPGQTEAA